MAHRLRRASDSDRPFLYALHCATMREAIENTWGWDETWQRNDFDRRFREHVVHVIEIGDRPVGGLWLESSPSVIYIADFQVLPEFQGRGVGTSVLQGLIAEGVARKVPVELSVLQVNARARRLYERLGFRVMREDAPFIRMQHRSDASEIAEGGSAPTIDFEIRRAGVGDVHDIASAHLDSIRSIGARYYDAATASDWGARVTGDLYVNAMARGEAFFIAIGELEGERLVLGFSSHRIDDSEHRTAVYVRGGATRRGIGSALFKTAEVSAIAAGASSIHIDASLAAVEFYRAHGFTELGRGEHRLGSGRPMPCVFMRKDLRTRGSESSPGKAERQPTGSGSRGSSPSSGYYGRDLALVHHRGFRTHADACAPGLLRLLDPTRAAGGCVVELGCGSGHLTRHLVDAGLHVIATDASAAMLELARRYVPEADLRRLVLPDDPIPEAHAIVSVGHVLNYLPDPAAIERALVAIARALRPGGVLAIDLCDLEWGTARRGAPPHAQVSDEWAIISRFSTPAPTRFVRDVTVFVRDDDGSWRRDDERHDNVLVDTSVIAALLSHQGIDATVGSSFGTEELPVGIKVVIGRRT